MTPQTLVLASGNPGKAREIEALLGAAFRIRLQSEWQIEPPTETGLTFVENALIKARYACVHTGLPALADDSGLEVDALDGAPGLYSARYAGEGASDADNLQKLLRELAVVPAEQRQARFRCVMVYLRHAMDPSPVIAEGCWEGTILTQPRGTGGFGYDPVFLVPDLNLASAELDPATKNRLSHRGQALAKLTAALQAIRP